MNRMRKESGVAFYDELNKIDVITPIVGKIAINITDEGRPVVFIGRSLDPNVPWINQRPKQERDCDLWMYYYFKYYGIIPKACRSCWKVMMKIKSLRQLMEIKDLQEEMGSTVDCKCGLEQRPYSGAIGEYRAFWYGALDEGLEGGRKLFKAVQKNLPGVKLILKRGCTEFENRYHPSGSWDKLAKERNWDFVEELLNALFVIESSRLTSTPKILEPYILKSWIDWAFEHGDETYLDYVESPPLKPLQTYQSSKEQNEFYKGSKYEPIKMKGLFSDGTDNSRRDKESETKILAEI